MNTIKDYVEEELIEKKSKFIVDIFYVETIEEVEENIKQIHKKYYDAKHHCFAYRLLQNDTIIEKASDDGEPSKTAGAPMLQVLNKNELVNILVVVTRYFGGILLGTGGLVRAYTQATQNALKKTKLLNLQKRNRSKSNFKLSRFGKLSILLSKKSNSNYRKSIWRTNYLFYWIRWATKTKNFTRSDGKKAKYTKNRNHSGKIH